MPELAKECIASWHRYMPDWEYRLWNEENFDVNRTPYTKEAYESGKFAFVSDYVRLWALEREGGLYLDTDVKAFKPFDDLLNFHAFAGFEGSMYQPIGTCVMASEAHGEWVSEMLEAYKSRTFLVNGVPDETTNVKFITSIMAAKGFKQDGSEQDCHGLHVLPVECFSPRHTTGEYILTENTYCDHLGVGSWTDSTVGWKTVLGRMVGSQNMIRLIKLKRKFFN